MTWYALRSPRGTSWAFNPDGIYPVVRGAVRARIIRRRSRIVSSDHGFLLPTTYNLETNWNGFRAEADRESARYWEEAEMQLRHDPDTFRNTLIGLFHDQEADTAWYRTQMRDAQHRSSRNIDRTVSNWGTAVDVARTIRDGSATVLIVTAGVATGGTGMAAAGAVGMTGVSTGTAVTTLAVGSAMRGTFTYQDTGNVGSAMLNATGSFTVGMVGLGAAGATFTGAETATLVVVSSGMAGTVSVGQALVEGRSVRDAAVSGIVAAGGQALGSVVGARIENLGFVAQIVIGAGIDTAAGMASNALTSPTVPVPRRTGAIDFVGTPTSPEGFVSRNCLVQIR